jgi:hypothetical protein
MACAQTGRPPAHLACAPPSFVSYATGNAPGVAVRVKVRVGEGEGRYREVVSCGRGRHIVSCTALPIDLTVLRCTVLRVYLAPIVVSSRRGRVLRDPGTVLLLFLRIIMVAYMFMQFMQICNALGAYSEPILGAAPRRDPAVTPPRSEVPKYSRLSHLARYKRIRQDTYPIGNPTKSERRTSAHALALRGRSRNSL